MYIKLYDLNLEFSLQTLVLIIYIKKDNILILSIIYTSLHIM